jgi:nitric oxide reductase large subunit
MNQKAQRLVTDFYNSVLDYMKAEYKPRWVKLYKNKEISDGMIRLTHDYYWGGNSVANTAGDIVDLLRSKYGN